jgi:hypothetical protein
VPFDQIPRIPDLMALAVDGLLGSLTGERRTARARHAITGFYGDVLRGWGAQAQVVQRRLVTEVMARRLGGAQGDALSQLAKSEFRITLPDDPRRAIGSAVITREVQNDNSGSTNNFTPVVVPKGNRFRRPANSDFPIPLLEAQYQATEAVYCGTDDTSAPVLVSGSTYRHRQTKTIPIEATREGPHANTPALFGFGLANAPTMLDSVDTFTCSSISASGGTNGIVEDQIKALARAMASGYYGPTSGAALAGALTNPGVRYCAVGRNDYGVFRVYTADESWASATRHRAAVLQELKDYPWVGWGCRVISSSIQNYPVGARVTVMLRSRDYDSEKTEITTAIQEALESYFEDRPDWWVFSTNMVGAAVANADRRIAACTSASVIYYADGSVFPETEVTPGRFDPIPHYALIRKGVEVTYTTPG